MPAGARAPPPCPPAYPAAAPPALPAFTLAGSDRRRTPPQMGRFTLRDEGTTIGIGKVLELRA